MSFEWLSVYDCFRCGTSECATSVQYDRFGFPICDRCRAHGRARLSRN